MVLEQYSGPLRPYLSSIAYHLSGYISRTGLTPPSESALLDALIITSLLIILSFQLLLRTSRDLRNSVLILGISGEADSPGPGKTSLFNVLRYGSLPKHGTLPSMIVNEATFETTGLSNPVGWVDFPGHPLLRHQLPQYLATAKCIVFVIDIATFSTHARKDAQLLYYVLTSPSVAKSNIPVLLFCNKSDLPNVAKVATVQARLEAELERAKTSDASKLQSAGIGASLDGDAVEDRVYLGFENEPFSFEHTSGPVTFATGSASSGNVQAIVDFAKTSFS